MSSLNIYSQLANRIDGMPRDTPNHPPEDYWVKILSLMVTEREADVDRRADCGKGRGQGGGH